MRSLRFGTATSDRIACGLAAPITGATKFSGGALLKVTTFTASRQIASKGLSAGSRGWFIQLNGTGGNYEVFFGGGTAMRYVTTNTPLKLNRWQYVAWTCDSSLGATLKAHIYTSPTLGSALVEATYSFTEGATPAADSSADTYFWANLGSLASSLQGSIALGFYSPNVVLSLDELKNWQRRPFTPPRGCRLFTVMGHNGRGLVRDWSPTGGNTGTITGAVAAEGPPGYAQELLWRGHKQQTTFSFALATCPSLSTVAL